MEDDEAKESALACTSSVSSAMRPCASYEDGSAEPAKKQQKRMRPSAELDVSDKQSASAEWQVEIDGLYEYYKEVSGYQLNPEELACTSDDSIIACLLEESCLTCARLTDKICKRVKLQDGVTESSVRNLVLKIGRRSPYGISAVDANKLEDESDSSLWCWETHDLALLPSHLHNTLSIRRKARKLIHERVLFLSGKQAAEDTPDAHRNQNIHSLNAGEVKNLDAIRSFVEESKQKNDSAITKIQIKTKAQELQSTRESLKEQKMTARQMEHDQKKKVCSLLFHSAQDQELNHRKEKSEREEKRIERESKRLKKRQEEADKAKKRKEKEEAELKRQADIQRQANFMERLFKRKPNSNTNTESSASHHLEKTTCSKSYGNIEQVTVATTSVMDCTSSQPNHLRVEEFWVEHVARWRKVSKHNKLCHWGVRRSAKVQIFPDLKLRRASATAPFGNILAPTKEQSSQEGSGCPDFTQLLDELRTPSLEKIILSTTARYIESCSVFSVKKLLQFDGSSRPPYYGTLRKKSSTVSARKPFQRDPELNYGVESDEEWEEEDPGERLSDFDEDDEMAMNEHESMEEETENSFVVPNDYLSEDESMRYETLSGKFDETCSMLNAPWSIVEELDVLLQRQRTLHRATEYALSRERPLIISNLDHRKLELLKANDITGMLRVEGACLQALCMKKFPGSPIIDVPVAVNMTMENLQFCRSNKKSPRIPVPSKSVSDSDMPEFVRLITSCNQGMRKLVELLQERFPFISKVQLERRVREIAEFTNNRWQIFLNRLRKIHWIGTVYLHLQVKLEARNVHVQHLSPSSHWMNRASLMSLLLSLTGYPKRANNKWVRRDLANSDP